MLQAWVVEDQTDPASHLANMSEIFSQALLAVSFETRCLSGAEALSRLAGEEVPDLLVVAWSLLAPDILAWMERPNLVDVPVALMATDVPGVQTTRQIYWIDPGNPYKGLRDLVLQLTGHAGAIPGEAVA